MSTPAAGPARAKSHDFLACGLALFLAACVHAGAVRTFFAADDITFLSRAAGLAPAFPWFRPLSEGLAFRIELLAFGLDSFRWHVVNLVLHVVATAGVYALARRWGGGPIVAGAAAILFGCSGIAFTPVHWTSGVTELLAGALLAAATLVHLESRRGGMRWAIAAAGVALLAMLARELAVTWPLLVLVIERGPGAPRRSLGYVVPAFAAAAAELALFTAGGLWHRFAGSEAYVRSLAPDVLLGNLATFVAWSFTPWNPIPDLVASPDPQAWRVALPVAVVVAWALRRGLGGEGLRLGLAWWLAFLLPVLPLANHTYLYYAYVPWMGGAIAAAALGHAILARAPRRLAAGAALLLLAGFVAIEARQVRVRETATRDFLPADRTMRESMLLVNALGGIRTARLPAGSAVRFVSPLTRAPFDVVRGAPTRPEDAANRTSYFPLEAAMRGGETLRLFFPALRSAGFSRTIPPGDDSSEVFLFEQRGYLRHWGRGPAARERQSALFRAAGIGVPPDSSAHEHEPR